MMRSSLCLSAAVAVLMLTSASGCGLKGDLYLAEPEKAAESPAAEPKLSEEVPGETGIIEPAGTEPSDGNGAGLVADDSVQSPFNDADAESALSDEEEDEKPKAAAPAPR